MARGSQSTSVQQSVCPGDPVSVLGTHEGHPRGAERGRRSQAVGRFTAPRGQAPGTARWPVLFQRHFRGQKAWLCPELGVTEGPCHRKAHVTVTEKMPSPLPPPPTRETSRAGPLPLTHSPPRSRGCTQTGQRGCPGEQRHEAVLLNRPFRCDNRGAPASRRPPGRFQDAPGAPWLKVTRCESSNCTDRAKRVRETLFKALATGEGGRLSSAPREPGWEGLRRHLGHPRPPSGLTRRQGQPPVSLLEDRFCT